MAKFQVDLKIPSPDAGKKYRGTMLRTIELKNEVGEVVAGVKEGAHVILHDDPQGDYRIALGHGTYLCIGASDVELHGYVDG